MVGAIARNICRIIGRTGDASAVDILDEVLAGSDVEARVAAAVAMGRLPRTARSEEILCLALADEDPQARAAACRSLGQLGLRGAEDSLVAATGDPAAFVRAAAVQSLVLLGSPSCLGRLRDLIMDDESPSVVVHAIEGLGKLHEADDLMLLMNLCASKDVEVTKAAARALVGFHTHRATAALLGLLSHERWDVRWVAAEALTERADPTALESLRLAAQREEDPLVQETLTSAAERLAAQGGQHS